MTKKRIPSPNETFLTLAETARLFRCSVATVKNRVNEGALKPRFRKGCKMLFLLSDLVGQ